MVGGRYRLDRRLGEGGAAEVWLAYDTQLDVLRAIKVLTGDAARRPTMRRRLRAEAQVMARLDHPHVLRVVDIGTTLDDRDFLVMEYLPGGSLADQVRDAGPLSPDEAVGRMMEVLAALAAAHARGIVHRDIKPQNVLLAEDGRAVLADFGIALVEAGDRRTRTGVAMGSFAFMPPEQRFDAKRVGPTADIYAAGCTLYWLLTAKNPVDLFQEDPDSPRFAALPPHLARAITAATRHEPSERPPDAAAFAAMLRGPGAAPLPGPLSPETFPAPDSQLSQGPSPRTWAIAGAAALALVASALAGLALWASVRPPPQPFADIAPPVYEEPAWEPGLFWPRRTEAEAKRRVVRAPARLPPAWVGSFDGRPTTLALVGPPDALRGIWSVRFDGNAVDMPVRGTWDAKTGVLRLADVGDAADAGWYEATYQAAGSERRTARLEGRFFARHRPTVLSFSIRQDGE